MPCIVDTSDSAREDALRVADSLARAADYKAAIREYHAAIAGVESPRAGVCLKLARCYERAGDQLQAYRWALATVDGGPDHIAWMGATALIEQRLATVRASAVARSRRVALLANYTASTWAPLLQLASLRRGIGLDLYQCPYGQIQQTILDSSSGLYRFAPEMVLLAVDERDARLPEFSENPDADVQAEAGRWRETWRILAERLNVTIIQHNFVLPENPPFGHCSRRFPGLRSTMIARVNAELGEAAPPNVALVDCERLSGVVGKRAWFDPRLWHTAKCPVSLKGQALLARHTAALIAAESGLTRKCLVLDLDNTLWGGTIGEDGLSGIQIGNGPDGEAFSVFQDYLVTLKNQGVLLAVCSKNDEAQARGVFASDREMKLKLTDFVAFVANWEPKPSNLQRIAQSLNIGLDSMVFVDDSPAEREAVRRLAPAVEVIPLPTDPALYIRAVSESLLFERWTYTEEDRRRTEMYRARADSGSVETTPGDLGAFYKGLRMTADVRPIGELDLPRVTELVGKTNQFNVTTRRYNLSQLCALQGRKDCVHFTARLRDCFTDHGLVGVLIAFIKGDVLELDSWLMSCRVIGRTLDAVMLAELCRRAERIGVARIRATYIPTPKNGLVHDIFPRYGFRQISTDEKGITGWVLDLPPSTELGSEYIEVISHSEAEYDRTSTARGHAAGVAEL